MLYLQFETESQANLAEQKIVENIRNWVIEFIPERLSEDGNLLSIATDGTIRENAIATDKWATPQQTFDNFWIIPKPLQEKMGRVPISVVLDSVGGIDVEDPLFGTLPTVEGAG